MHGCSFDVQLVMQGVYTSLKGLGFEPQIAIAPAEWNSPQGGYVRFAHVAGWLEVWHRPGGQTDTMNERHWRFDKSKYGLVGFQAELDGVLATIREHLAFATPGAP